MTRFPDQTRAWAITDGKAGDLAQVLGLLERAGVAFESRVVAPRAPWVWALPFGPLDPRERPGRDGGPLAGPLPDIAIATGRRAVAALRALKSASAGRTFTVCLKQPATGRAAADLIWVQAHDRLRGDNVFVTLTSPHRISPARLDAARLNPAAELAALPAPRIAVLVGGPNRVYRYSDADIARLIAGLERLRATTGASLMITPSRRTPAALTAELVARFGRPAGFVWDMTGANPYVDMLALADAVVVTADSTNMMSEAPATGAPLLLFRPSGDAPKMDRLAATLIDAGIARWLDAADAPGDRYPPVDATETILDRIAAAYAAHRAGAAR